MVFLYRHGMSTVRGTPAFTKIEKQKQQLGELFLTNIPSQGLKEPMIHPQ